MRMKWVGNRKAISAAFGAALLILVLIGATAYLSTRGLILATVSREQSYQVFQHLDAMLSQVEDAETGQRGYLITGEERYLQPYFAALEALDQTTKALREMTANDPDQQRDLDDVEPLVATKLAELQQTIDLRREKGFDAAREVVLTNAGKNAMDDIRKNIAAMRTRDQAALNRNQQTTETAARRSILVLLLGGAVTVALLLSIFFLLKQEITVRTQAEEKITMLNEGLEERTAELEVSNKELEAFTYSVAHDLRAPLRHIDGFSKMLMEEDSAGLSDEAKRYLTRIRQGTSHMGQLVDDLLNLARLGRQELSLQVTGLSSLVEDVLKDMKAENPDREIHWNIQPLPFVECDPGLIRQVFSNLLSNAVKYTRPRKMASIEVSQANENGETIILVRDNGVGFSMKYADKLFGVFQRLHRPEDFEGTGVGLATVQRIVRKHGGRAWAEAELDKGATFYFTLGKRKTEGSKQKAEGSNEKAEIRNQKAEGSKVTEIGSVRTVESGRKAA